MELGQWWRRFWREAGGRRIADEGPVVERVETGAPSGEPALAGAGGLARWTAIAVAALVLMYHPIGSILDHEIRDDIAWEPPAAPEGASRSVAIAAGLITREVDEVGWVANTPPVAPNALLKYGGNMMNFQIGVTTALGLFAVEMRDRLGRARGSSTADPDLTSAASDIQYDPERWVFRWGRILPEASAEDQYKNARNALITYNTRLARGEAVFDARADNLLALLDRIAFDLGASSAEIERQIAEGRRAFPFDRRADKLYYNVKGRAYAFTLLLRGLRADFGDVIDARPGVAGPYDEMIAELALVAGAKPLIVMNGAPSGMSANNHLAAQGFYLLRARTKMREITDILAK
ncbi:MAG: DUF2333 family protein [Caulobacterales bacterium]|nr:DUF2333 family protein [Caulobacterales bacterium]